MASIILGLGTNLGDRIANINKAYDLLEKKLGPIISKSSYYESEPWGVLDQPNFINTAAAFNAEIPTHDLLDLINSIEKDLGRIRYKKWAERIIDIDILFYDQEIIHSQKLDIPHPYIHQRSFVIKPAAEIAPDYIHPELNENLKSLSLSCKDTTKLEIQNARS